MAVLVPYNRPRKRKKTYAAAEHSSKPNACDGNAWHMSASPAFRDYRPMSVETEQKPRLRDGR
jgi:hypothetical protein